jgi:tRNA(fMet)-specific endonuclease VapC
LFNCSCRVAVRALKYGNADRRRSIVTETLSPFASLPFDDAAAERYANLRSELQSSGQVIGPLDMQIAAICLAANCTLVTHNVGEFSRVSGLQVEDWFAIN